MKKYDYSKYIRDIDYSDDYKLLYTYGYLALILTIMILSILFFVDRLIFGLLVGQIAGLMLSVSIACLLNANNLKNIESKRKKEWQEREDLINKEWQEREYLIKDELERLKTYETRKDI